MSLPFSLPQSLLLFLLILWQVKWQNRCLVGIRCAQQPQNQPGKRHCWQVGMEWSWMLDQAMHFWKKIHRHTWWSMKYEKVIFYRPFFYYEYLFYWIAAAPALIEDRKLITVTKHHVIFATSSYLWLPRRFPTSSPHFLSPSALHASSPLLPLPTSSPCFHLHASCHAFSQRFLSPLPLSASSLHFFYPLIHPTSSHLLIPLWACFSVCQVTEPIKSQKPKANTTLGSVKLSITGTQPIDQS